MACSTRWCHPVDGDTQKPEIILYYNSAKSGVDNLDHLATMYTSRRKVNRWPVALFGNVVDVGAAAAFIVWLGNFPQWKISEGKRRRRLFLSELGNFLFLFKQYLNRGAQFSEAGLNGALFNINLLTNNIIQNTEFQITKVLT